MIGRYKCVLSLRIARHLMTQGFRLVDSEPSRKHFGKLVFIFENTPELDAELAKFTRD